MAKHDIYYITQSGVVGKLPKGIKGRYIPVGNSEPNWEIGEIGDEDEW